MTKEEQDILNNLIISMEDLIDIVAGLNPILYDGQNMDETVAQARLAINKAERRL